MYYYTLTILYQWLSFYSLFLCMHCLVMNTATAHTHTHPTVHVCKHAFCRDTEDNPRVAARGDRQQTGEKTRRKNECWISPQINITSGCGWETLWCILSSLSITQDYVHKVVVLELGLICYVFWTVGAGVQYCTFALLLETKVRK